MRGPSIFSKKQASLLKGSSIGLESSMAARTMSNSATQRGRLMRGGRMVDCAESVHLVDLTTVV